MPDFLADYLSVERSTFVYTGVMSREARDGDLSRFCAREYPSLVGALSLYWGDHWTAEELAQEALAIACRDWRKVRRMDNPRAWLYRVAMNLSKSRARRIHAELRANEKTSHDAVEVEQSPDVATALDVRSAVSGLPRRQRQALVYRHYLGLSVRDTATYMECSEGTVRALTSQAKSSLVERLGLAREEVESSV